MSASLRLKLGLLKYPRLDHLSLSDPVEIAGLVSFIEDRFVRQWAIEKRTPLRKPGLQWAAGFELYLKEAGCPLLEGAAAFEELRMAEYIAWLVSRAVGMDYEDKAAEYNASAAAELALAAAPAREAASSSSSAASTEAADSSPAVQAAVRELAALLHVQTEGRSSLQILQTAHRVIRQRVLPAIAVSSADAADDGPRSRAALARRGPGVGPKELLELNFPLGFSTGSDVLDRAAAILRMLYIADLRELQDAVNDLVVQVQEFTANPKTDSSLGLVGR